MHIHNNFLKVFLSIQLLCLVDFWCSMSNVSYRNYYSCAHSVIWIMRLRGLMSHKIYSDVFILVMAFLLLYHSIGYYPGRDYIFNLLGNSEWYWQMVYMPHGVCSYCSSKQASAHFSLFIPILGLVTFMGNWLHREDRKNGKIGGTQPLWQDCQYQMVI